MNKYISFLRISIFFYLLFASFFGSRVQAQHRLEFLTEFTPGTPSLQLGAAYELQVGDKWAISLAGKFRSTRLLKPENEPFGNFLVAPGGRNFIQSNTFAFDLPFQLHRNLWTGKKLSLRAGIGPEVRWEKAIYPRGTGGFGPQVQARALGMIISTDLLQKAFGPFSIRYGIRFSQSFISRYILQDSFGGTREPFNNGSQIAFQLGFRLNK